MDKIFAYIILSSFIGMLGGIPGMLAIMFIRGIVYMPFVKKKRMAQAKTVIAKLDYGSIRSGDDTHDPASAFYYYKIDDKTYKYKVIAYRFNLTDEIKLYYMPGSEAHAKSANEFTADKHAFLTSYIVASIICAIAIFIIILKRA